MMQLRHTQKPFRQNTWQCVNNAMLKQGGRKEAALAAAASSGFSVVSLSLRRVMISFSLSVMRGRLSCKISASLSYRHAILFRDAEASKRSISDCSSTSTHMDCSVRWPSNSFIQKVSSRMSFASSSPCWGFLRTLPMERAYSKAWSIIRLGFSWLTYRLIKQATSTRETNTAIERLVPKADVFQIDTGAPSPTFAHPSDLLLPPLDLLLHLGQVLVLDEEFPQALAWSAQPGLRSHSNVRDQNMFQARCQQS